MHSAAKQISLQHEAAGATSACYGTRKSRSKKLRTSTSVCRIIGLKNPAASLGFFAFSLLRQGLLRSKLALRSHDTNIPL